MIYISESFVFDCIDGVFVLIFFIFMSGMSSMYLGWKKGICFSVIALLIACVAAGILSDISMYILENTTIVEGV